MARSIGPEVLDTVSAIWMLACNDADAIITYRGIANRVLGSDVKHDKELVEKAKNLVKDWPQLFSPVVATDWFQKWQNDVSMGTIPDGCLNCGRTRRRTK
ncbi:MAG: hypothetical protein M3Z96_00370 [Pseudomonadota bacterium]|nr:hypothetical protein [Pseudomonadota bacterium]